MERKPGSENQDSPDEYGSAEIKDGDAIVGSIVEKKSTGVSGDVTANNFLGIQKLTTRSIMLFGTMFYLVGRLIFSVMGYDYALNWAREIHPSALALSWTIVMFVLLVGLFFSLHLQAEPKSVPTLFHKARSSLLWVAFVDFIFHLTWLWFWVARYNNAKEVDNWNASPPAITDKGFYSFYNMCFSMSFVGIILIPLSLNPLLVMYSSSVTSFFQYSQVYQFKYSAFSIVAWTASFCMYGLGFVFCCFFVQSGVGYKTVGNLWFYFWFLLTLSILFVIYFIAVTVYYFAVSHSKTKFYADFWPQIITPKITFLCWLSWNWIYYINASTKDGGPTKDDATRMDNWNKSANFDDELYDKGVNQTRLFVTWQMLNVGNSVFGIYMLSAWVISMYMWIKSFTGPKSTTERNHIMNVTILVDSERAAKLFSNVYSGERSPMNIIVTIILYLCGIFALIHFVWCFTELLSVHFLNKHSRLVAWEWTYFSTFMVLLIVIFVAYFDKIQGAKRGAPEIAEKVKEIGGSAVVYLMYVGMRSFLGFLYFFAVGFLYYANTTYDYNKTELSGAVLKGQDPNNIYSQHVLGRSVFAYNNMFLYQVLSFFFFVVLFQDIIYVFSMIEISAVTKMRTGLGDMQASIAASIGADNPASTVNQPPSGSHYGYAPLVNESSGPVTNKTQAVYSSISSQMVRRPNAPGMNSMVNYGNVPVM